MDPISICTASIALVGASFRILTSIAALIADVRNVDAEIHVLRIEMVSLHQVLLAISNNFNDPALRLEALESQTGHEAEHWRNVARSMADCKDTLESMQRKLQKARGTGKSWFGRPATMVRWSWDSAEITMLKQRLAAYRGTMNLSLQMISVYVILFF